MSLQLSLKHDESMPLAAHLDVRVRVADGAAIVHHNEGHTTLAKLRTLHLAQLVRSLLLRNSCKTPQTPAVAGSNTSFIMLVTATHRRAQTESLTRCNQQASHNILMTSLQAATPL